MNLQIKLFKLYFVNMYNLLSNHFEELDNVFLIVLEWQVTLIKYQDGRVHIENRATL